MTSLKDFWSYEFRGNLVLGLLLSGVVSVFLGWVLLLFNYRFGIFFSFLVFPCWGVAILIMWREK